MDQPGSFIFDGQIWTADLLSVCALLRSFDRDLLGALAEHGDDEVGTLLASDLVEAAAGMEGMWRLRDDARVEVLEWLRAERPSDELTWHRRIFEHVLRQMRETDLAERRAAIEDGHAIHHLGELFRLYAAHQEWHVFGELIAEVYAAGPVQPRLLSWLGFYDGFVSIRAQRYERGEAILAGLLATGDLEDELRVQALNALGQANFFQARYDRGLDYYRQAHALASATNNLSYQAAALLNMGAIYSEINAYEQALELTAQSLEIFRAAGDGYAEAHALYSCGHLAMWLGRWEIARRYFRESIELNERLAVRARLAYLHWAQGFLAHMLADEAASEAAYRRALAIAQSKGTEQAALVMDSWLYLGFLYQTQERYDEALAAYDRAARVAGDLRNQHGYSLIHYRRGNVFERQGRPRAALEAYRAALAGIETLRGDIKTEEIKIGLVGTIQQLYESIVLLCLDSGMPEEAFAYVEQARSRAFLDQLAEKHPDLRERVAQPVVSLAELRAALPPDALLVEYYTVGVLPRGEALINKIPAGNRRLREHLALAPRVIGFAITRDSLDVFYPSVDPNALRPQPGDPGPGRRLLRDRLLVHLYDQLIAPVAGLLAGRRWLFLIPHGPLHYVPFMALRSAHGQHLLDARNPAIALAPSATVLARNCLGRARAEAPRDAGALALGYNDAGEDALRYAEIEAGRVARLAGGAALLGPEPKILGLAAGGRTARWLHVAGHAVYDPHDPLGSYLKLGAGELLTARRIMAELELGAELVTLSACMSGVTHVVPGDELLGLQRALLYAGAPAVVCALWEAADLVALLVMDRFYRDLARGRAPAEALRDAQAAVRAMTGRDLLAAIAGWRAEDPAFVDALGELPEVPDALLDAPIYADPLYWATFMLIGKPD